MYCIILLHKSSILMGQEKNFRERKESFGEQGAGKSIPKMSPGIIKR